MVNVVVKYKLAKKLTPQMFDLLLDPDNSPIDNTNITSTQLFYSTDENKEFKELVKAGMVRMYPETYTEANLSDFILQILRIYNGKQ